MESVSHIHVRSTPLLQLWYGLQSIPVLSYSYLYPSLNYSIPTMYVLTTAAAQPRHCMERELCFAFPQWSAICTSFRNVAFYHCMVTQMNDIVYTQKDTHFKCCRVQNKYKQKAYGENFNLWEEYTSPYLYLLSRTKDFQVQIVVQLRATVVSQTIEKLIYVVC